ncbi:hypothetical protein EGW08_014872 [Elysia chlorotica]|uniref:SCP domain-containing protein n=1 Tax=Elysia chlorotica TaxID=188477 RepID=A0A3S0ZGW8_ELYCH|nr:hypothetical protein EGW08_014872 [Elysia chlorotica]
MCGHYTQNVWFSTYALGCGVKFCQPLNIPCGTSVCEKWDQGYYLVCHYGPAGNVLGRSPYKKGKPCSQCHPDQKYCNCKLCSVKPQIGSGSVDQKLHANFIVIVAPIVFIVFQL